MTVADAALMLNVLSRPTRATGLRCRTTTATIASASTMACAACASPSVADARLREQRRPRGRRRGRRRGAQLAELGAQVEQVDPASPIRSRSSPDCGFAGAWQRARSTLTAEQQRSLDPDLRARPSSARAWRRSTSSAATCGAASSASLLRQFMQRYDLLLTPTLAIPAFEAGPASHDADGAEGMLGWTPFSYPFNLTPAAGVHDSLRPDARRPADRPADRRSDVRRRPRAARRAGVRDDAADPEAAAGAGGLSQGPSYGFLGRLAPILLQPLVDQRDRLVEPRGCSCLCCFAMVCTRRSTRSMFGAPAASARAAEDGAGQRLARPSAYFSNGTRSFVGSRRATRTASRPSRRPRARPRGRCAPPP